MDGAKRTSFTARITERTRQILDEEAKATGRTASEVAAIWIDEGAEGRSGVDGLLGGSQVSDAIRAMIHHAHEVEQRVGHPSQEPAARDALIAGWRAIMDRAVPFIPANQLDEKVSERREDARAMLREALTRLNQQLEDDPSLADAPPVLPVSLQRAGLFGLGRPERATQQIARMLGGVDDPTANHIRETLRSYVYGDSLQAFEHHPAIKVLRAWADRYPEAPIFHAAADLLDAYSQALGERLDESARAYRQGMDMGDATAQRLEMLPEIARRALGQPKPV